MTSRPSVVVACVLDASVEVVDSAVSSRSSSSSSFRITYDGFVLWGEAVRNLCVNARLRVDPEEVCGSLLLEKEDTWMIPDSSSSLSCLVECSSGKDGVLIVQLSRPVRTGATSCDQMS